MSAGALESQRCQVPLELGLQAAVCARTQTQVLWKSSVPSWLLSHVSSPSAMVFP